MPASGLRLVAVSRVLNEEDIIEPFIRHHAPMLDAHVVLDNGSTDRTLEILHSLADDGLRLTVLSSPSPIFVEHIFNTLLYGWATTVHGADWVFFLDADEFVDARGAGGDLEAVLHAQPPEIAAIRLPLLDYDAPAPHTRDLLNPVERIIRRQPEPSATGKVFVRGKLPVAGVVVAPGNHGIWLEDRLDEGVEQSGLVLAHFHSRSVYQRAAAALIGRLKVLASGRAALGSSTHYVATAEALKAAPTRWLREHASFHEHLQGASHLVDDPLPYLGGPLAYTTATDYPDRLLAFLLRYAEQLALSHGRLLDSHPAAREELWDQATQLVRLI